MWGYIIEVNPEGQDGNLHFVFLPFCWFWHGIVIFFEREGGEGGGQNNRVSIFK